MGFCPSGLLSQWAFVRSPSIPVVTLDTVSKNRSYLRNAWIACGKVKGVVPGKFQKATSNFILIV